MSSSVVSAEPTIVVYFAGGYSYVRLNFDSVENKVSLETFVSTDENMSSFEPDPHHPTKNFATRAEAWVEVGRRLGWVEEPCHVK